MGRLLAGFMLAAAAAAAAVQLEDLKKVDVADADFLDKTIPSTFMPCILFLSEGGQTDEAEAFVGKHYGLIRTAAVDTTDADLLDKLELDSSSIPRYRAYGYGEDDKQVRDFEDLDEAERFVRSTFPEGLVQTPAPEQVQQTMVDIIQQRKLPVFLYSNKGFDVPDIALKLSFWMKDMMSVAFIGNPPQAMIKEFGVNKLPAMLVMIPSLGPAEGDGQTLQFSIAPFDRTRFGGFKFENMIRFLLSVHTETKQNGVDKIFDMITPEKKEDAAAQQSQVKDIPPLFEITASTPGYCSQDKLGLCLIALLDGASPDKDHQLQVLKDAEAMSQGRLVHFMYLDATCHTDLASSFGVQLDLLPTVVAASPKKQKFAQLLGRFDDKSISEFLTGVLRGKVPLQDMPELPAISADMDCDAIHALDAEPIVEEDFDLADIMGEDVALDDEEENEAEVEVQQAETVKQSTEEELELEAKRRRAQAEIDKLNAKSKKKSSRRRRRRRRQKNKDEL